MILAVIHVPTFAISLTLLLNLLAYTGGFQLYLYLRKRFPKGPPITRWQSFLIVSAASVGAMAGSKLLGWLADPVYFWNHRDAASLGAARTIVGGILGGWLCLEAVKHRLKLTASGDVYVFPLIVGMSLARLAGFFNGLKDDSLGMATGLPWGVDLGDGVGRHPTQLYEIGFLLAAGGIFFWRLKTRRQRGCMFSQFMLAYLAFRIVVDFFKPRHTLAWVPLDAVQWAALLGIAYAFYHRNDSCCEAAGGVDPRTAVRGLEAEERELDATPQFLELTNSLCPVCLRKVEAKVVAEASKVYLHKFCPEHGAQRVLISDDLAYWRQSRGTHKAPTAPLRRNTAMKRGCPFDCGLCPDHEQHSCLAIVEITDACDLACPVCYAASNRHGAHRSLAQVEAMLDAVVASEGNIKVVQISGGEPTLHPDFFAILDAARRGGPRPIRHLMVNTNGRRIAEDPAFAEKLAGYLPGFEVYLQFDSLRPEALRRLRGRDLTDTRRGALEALNRHHISTTLVVTLAAGVNDDQLGEIIDFALTQPCVRGVTFQPVQAAGRLPAGHDAVNRLTLSAVRNGILKQHKLFTPADLLPVPCHPECLAMAYAIRRGKSAIPLSKIIAPQVLLDVGGNTICYEQDPNLLRYVRQLFSVAGSPASTTVNMNRLCCPPGGLPGEGGSLPIAYDQIFRVVIMQFMDAHSLDLRSLKRACVNIVHPDGRLIPFDTYNILYRDATRHSPSSATVPTIQPC
jgi:7,8-dihydro-6-hydroxymethylpterin dimethyltransferase